MSSNKRNTTDEDLFYSFIKEGKLEEIITHFENSNNKPWEYLDKEGYTSKFS